MYACVAITLNLGCPVLTRGEGGVDESGEDHSVAELGDVGTDLPPVGHERTKRKW